MNEVVCIVCGKKELLLVENSKHICKKCYEIKCLQEEYEELGVAANEAIFDREREYDDM